ADIIYNNSVKNGYVPARLTEEQIEELFQSEAKFRPYKLTVDLEKRVITDELGLEMTFEIDDFRRENLLNGWDDIGLTLRYEEEIAAYEKANGIV
ncbi:MAG: 3-isopropylmalate dehydratase small subunit, partial [Thermoguttaceae bacterium]|nr:3-isopropylmalate dehydratase small subunit [Thermoguttaceae bacterium]